MKVGNCMNKKGFTLVELLGVLVVLSVILMIAFPLITTYINKSKQKAYDTQMGLIITGLKDYVIEHKEVLPVNDTDYVTFTLGQLKALGIVNNSVVNPLDGKEIDDSMEFKIIKDGSKYIYQIVESSRLSRDDKNHTPYITLNGNILNYIDLDSTYNELGASATDYDGKPLSVTIDKTDLDVSTIGVYQIRYEAIDSNNTKSYAIRTVIVGEFKILANGTVVYYNPVTNTKCTSDEANNNTSLNSGCMKWYVFLDTEESTKYKILLNHNTSNDLVAWNANKILSAGPVTATAKLNTDTKDWNTSIKSSIRLITASEVASITSSTNWTNKSSAIQIYDANNISYAWLFDNVKDYYGYWTSTSVLDSDSDYTGSAWGVYVNDSKGYLTGADTIDETRIYGVRPVIEVDKSILK